MLLEKLSIYKGKLVHIYYRSTDVLLSLLSLSCFISDFGRLMKNFLYISIRLIVLEVERLLSF